MSLSTTKKPENGVIKTTLIKAGTLLPLAKKITENINHDLFGICLIFSLFITGIGLLFSVQFPYSWIIIVFILIIINLAKTLAESIKKYGGDN